jgi:peptidyl-prolyl cis-trans isomerase SurA
MFMSQMVSAQQGSSVLAVVNGEPITDLDVAKRMKLISITSGIPDNAQALSVLKPQVIHMLVDEKLIDQEANKLRIEADQTELSGAMASLAEKNGLSLSQFDEFLKQKGIDKNVLTEQIKHQVLWSELVTTRIRPMISVSNQEIEENEAFIRKAHEGVKEKVEQVKLAEIVIFASEKDMAKQLQFAKKLSEDLDKGADFAKVAKEFSLAPSATNGGDIGWIYIDQLAPEISSQIASLSSGRVTRPIVLPDGIHILKVKDIKKKKLTDSNEVKEDLVKEAILEQKLNLAIRSYLNKMRKNAYIKIN